MESDISETEIHHSRSQLDVYEDISNLRASDLKLRIEEMLRIKVSKRLNKIPHRNSIASKTNNFSPTEYRVLGITRAGVASSEIANRH